MNETNQAYQIREKLATLQASLEEKVPGIATLLRDIHGILKTDPDVVTLLSEEDCAILIAGLKKQTSTEIATSALKSGTRGKSLKNLTVADL